MTIHLGRPLPDASRDLPGTVRKHPWSEATGPLFGLAPGGVYPAAPVSRRAVRSYRTLSPLPCSQRRQAVCFLWHFPWGRPRRALPGTVFPWSPDFPPARRVSPIARKRSHPTVWLPICAAASAAGQAIFAQVAINRAVSESTVASTFVERKCR